MTTKLTTTTEKATTWEDRFDKQDFCFTDDFDGTRKLHTNGDFTKQVKAFIHAELSHQREAIVEELKHLLMCKEEKFLAKELGLDFNNGVENCINLIKNPIIKDIEGGS